MPELPEVETSRRGIAPHLEGKVVTDILLRQSKLRWPIPKEVSRLKGQVIECVERRAKYLLLRSSVGTMILHLGMSGSLRILPSTTRPEKHDHVDVVVGEHCMRLRDPRRFGAVLWTEDDPLQHDRLVGLGPEPLSEDFNTNYFYAQCRQRQSAIKQVLMDGKVVVGIGNIYATEALFKAGIHPQRKANNISKKRIADLVSASKQILAAAIQQGGTTLRDFQREDGKPGYFVQQLLVYGRSGQPCVQCGAPLKTVQIGQRASAYCGRCQR